MRPKGDQIFFPKAKGGQSFLPMQTGVQEKIGDQPSQTGAPLPVKNDSSLRARERGQEMKVFAFQSKRP